MKVNSLKSLILRIFVGVGGTIENWLLGCLAPPFVGSMYIMN